MGKRRETRKVKSGAGTPSVLEEFETPSDPADPAILEIVERMVEIDVTPVSHPAITRVLW